MTTPSQFTRNATHNDEGNFYQHFGIHPTTVSIYGKKESDIIEVTFDISEDQTVPKRNDKSMLADYWGWFCNEKQEFTMIYAKKFLLNMCFPYGLKGAEEAGQGKAYRLKVINEKGAN